MNAKPTGVRVTEAVLLLAGALVLVVVIAADDRRFYWTPLTLGLTYLAAALAGGREGGHWATACSLVGWCAAVVVVGAGRPHLVLALRTAIAPAGGSAPAGRRSPTRDRRGRARG